MCKRHRIFENANPSLTDLHIMTVVKNQHSIGFRQRQSALAIQHLALHKATFNDNGEQSVLLLCI
jgi:hypothetical protein